MSLAEIIQADVAVRRFKAYPAYKDSGVEWLGKIPAYWQLKRLKLVAPARISKLDSKPDEMTYVGLEHVESGTGRLLLDTQPETIDGVVASFEPGDVIFGKLRPYLAKVARPSFAGTCTSELVPLRPAPGCFQDYLFYSLLSAPLIRWLDSLTYGARMPRVSPEQLGDTFIAVPPTIEQRAIAGFLDRETARIDALVAKKEKLIALLQEKRTALITRAVTKGLDPNAPMKDSGVEWLGQIPAHWEVKRLRHISPSLGVGVVVNPSEYVTDHGLPFLYGSDVSEGQISADKARQISEIDSRRLPKSRLRPNDLVMVRVGAPGVTAVVPPQLNGANCASLLVIRGKPGLSSTWLCYALNSRYVRSQVEVVQYGAAQEQFNVSHAVNFVVAVPPAKEQQTIAAFLDFETTGIDALVLKVRGAIGRLREFRTAVISAAVTGKIDVRGEVA